MGSLAALDMAEQVDAGNVRLEAAVSWHLTSNHFPPHPAFMVAPCVAAILLGQDEDWDADVDLPLGCETHHVVLYVDSETGEYLHPDGSSVLEGCEMDNVVQWRDREDGKVRVGDIIESFRLESFL